jgi:hypothetical protein
MGSPAGVIAPLQAMIRQGVTVQLVLDRHMQRRIRWLARGNR